MPGLVRPAATLDRPGIDISLSPTPFPRGTQIHQSAGRYKLTLDAVGDDWLFRWGPHDEAVRVGESGRSLRCHCPDPSRRTLLGEVLARRILPRVSVLHDRLPIHAATLGDGHSATMLLGASGGGKSTMTAALAQRPGWSIFSDDTSVLDESDRVFPTMVGVSLWGPSQRALRLPPEDCRPLGGYAGKVWYTPRRQALSPPLKLRSIILLSFKDGSGEISCERQSGPTALVMVSSQIVPLNPRDAGHMEAMLDRYKRLLDVVPVYAVAYPRDFAVLPQAVDAIEAAHRSAAGS